MIAPVFFEISGSSESIGSAKRNSEYEIALEELEDYLPARSPDTVEQTIAAKELARMIEHFLDFKERLRAILQT